MKVLMVVAEYAPLAKTGGLADAAAGLSAALHRRGHDVRVLLPHYGLPLPAGWRISPAHGAHGGRAAGYLEVEGPQAGPTVYLLDAPELARDGVVYTADDRDGPRFLRFTRGALELAAALDWQPDVVHCHDWHAALVPGLLRSPDAAAGWPIAAPTVLTLHNLGYQGAFPRALLADGGFGDLARLAADEDRDADHVAFLKIGIRHADRVTTVSPTYAREICTPHYGMGLDESLRRRGDDVVGILNGVDYGTWSPESDPFIERYDRTDPSGKRRVKQALCDALGLADEAPVIGIVTRLFEQKGIDLLVDALPGLLERTRARFALLGSGDPVLERALRAHAERHPQRVAFRAGYDEALAHRILAGSDLLLVPSRYEPCGLTQLYAMRYGTIPVVRATGGLADTVQHFDPASGKGTGSVFDHADAQGLTWGVTTALGWYDDAPSWRRLVDNAMRADYSWERQVEPYESLYAALRKR